MQFIIRVSPEITIKSLAVRKKAIRLLIQNIKKHLKLNNLNKFNLIFSWDRVDLFVSENISAKAISDLLKDIFWIAYFEEVIESDFIDFEDTFKKVSEYYMDKIHWKSFVVRVKRSWKHDFASHELERFLGTELLKLSQKSSVNLKSPDIKVSLNIIDKKLFIVKNRYEWSWWYPTWFQENVLSLISGWFDSTVATYKMMKRWVKCDFLFFNMWWEAHKLAVKQVSYYLYKRYSSAYNSSFITIDLEPLIQKMMEVSTPKYRSVLLKRYMLKLASIVSKDRHFALVKWDSLWQVSSQTLQNISLIDKSSSTVVLRPLISYDKEEIINISKSIWTYDFAKSMPEYCWIVSDSPSTKAREEVILEEEQKIWEDIIWELIENAKVQKINYMLDNEARDNMSISFTTNIWDKDVIIDIRESIKIEKKPFSIEWVEKIEIPFYEINHKFKALDKTKNYLLYCDKWVLSKLHALYLRDMWFKNIWVYRPE